LIDISPNMPILQAPRVQIGQIFTNLISNAIKYHDKQEGVISISFKSYKQVYEFSITDDGPGIAPECHEKVFMIFQTLQARDKLESTGIGLTIVKKIVEEYGGHVTLESELGKGATFHFTCL